MLDLAGSAWKVSDTSDPPSLERRVEQQVEDAAKAEMAEAGNAARHLRAAWHKVYGRSVDASGGFREAVRAVEAATKPVVTPSDRTARLDDPAQLDPPEC